jgi:hypothetical protein
VLTICLVKGSPLLGGARLSLQPKIHEMEVAHAAGQRMLGLHARVGGRWWPWYAAGAEHWYDVERDLVVGFLDFDIAAYLHNLDAIEVCPSSDAPGRVTGWYAGGTVKLRGFYFAQTNPTLGCVLLSGERSRKLTGYAAGNGQLYRFEEIPGGDHQVLSIVCPSDGPDWSQPPTGVFSTILAIADGPEAGAKLITILAPRSYLAPTGPVGRSCREVSRIPGTLVMEDRDRLLDWSRKNSPPMQFYRNIEDMPGYAGVGLPPERILPSGGVPVENVTLDLPAVEIAHAASGQRVPQLRITTVPLPGAFSAFIPVKHTGTLSTPCWIVLNLQVRRGRVGFAAYDRTSGTLLQKTLAIAPSPGPQRVALYEPNLGRATDVIVFNLGDRGAEVDVFDAAVLAKSSR